MLFIEANLYSMDTVDPIILISVDKIETITPLSGGLVSVMMESGACLTLHEDYSAFMARIKELDDGVA